MFRLSHSLAAQTAAATAIATIAIIGLPVAAQQIVIPIPVLGQESIDSDYGHQIVSRFGRMGSIGQYENVSLQTSSFDFQRYINDVCYRAVAFDQTGCRNRFGPYANLKNTLLSGQLMQILYAERDIIGDAYRLVSAAIFQATAGEGQGNVTVNAAMTTNQIQRERARILWDACESRYLERAPTNICFQSNRRLVSRTDVPVLENISYGDWIK